ncbi:MAG: dihydrolipoyl dehydrogenase [Alphaproteobacteria bacterium]|nr:dihydrolipoyl dehydrogenase [Alphaproteobacteria bacterium]
MADKFDLAVVGGGPGGYVAAIRAAQLGMSVAVIEVEHLGGICLNWGCIPTKALLRASEIHHLLQHLDEFGFAADNIRFDMAKVVARSRRVARRLSGGVSALLKKNKVKVYDGRARITAPGALAVEKDGKTVAEINASHIILATGARARQLPWLESDGDRVWTYREAMVPEALPKSLLIVGSGAIGIEFASFYRQMGAEVTVVEVQSRILPVEDEEISALAAKAFKAQGIALLTSSQVTALTKARDKVTAVVNTPVGEQRIEAERVISAAGIVGNVENIGLEAVGVKVANSHVVANEWGETGVKGLYAIGDLAGPPWLAHKASHEGVVCVERIAGRDPHPLDKNTIPGCTYSMPQIASVGLTEAAAKAEGREVKVGRFPYAGNGKAIALGESEGLVKTVFDANTGELLGAHMIGAEVTELIQGYVVAKTHETTAEALAATVFAHPTLSETMHESVLDALGRRIHF